jgi:hypothetical protein
VLLDVPAPTIVAILTPRMEEGFPTAAGCPAVAAVAYSLRLIWLCSL